MKKRPSDRPPRHKKKSHPVRHSSHLAEISVLTIVRINDEGELIGEPVKWDARKKPPHILVTESGRSRAAVVGDKVLAKLRKISPHTYQGMVIKVLPGEQPRPVIGVFVATENGGLIEPVSRRMKESFVVGKNDTLSAEPGELVAGMTLPGMPSLGMTFAKITERLGRVDSPRAASLIAANMHALPQVFSQEALAEAEMAKAPYLMPSPLEGEGWVGGDSGSVLSTEQASPLPLTPSLKGRGNNREDLRDIPLVTIDGEDARDFDDAVFAEPDGDGFHIIVAIADVAHYVREESELDREAFERGNSVYFPDRVIPMLPERLSNGLCSLVPNEDRYCLAVHLWIDAQGVTKKYRFVRGIMRSAARLTYETVEGVRCQETGVGKIINHTSDTRHLTPDTLIVNLYAAYAALARERDRRGALDLDLPEFKILFDDKGNVADIVKRVRLESHRLIEAFMIAANVAAADFLLDKRAPGIYRVHEPPAQERLDELRTLLTMSGYNLQKGGIRAEHLNRVLKASTGKPEQPMVHTAVLRAQMQAFYSNENLGHFGLSLQKYCHFTSPIRRYADLVVHRSLTSAMSDDTMRDNTKKKSSHLSSVALHISETERKAMMAERDAADRYKVSYMSRHIGQVFPGAITGLNEYGLFVTLPANGITGFVPVRNLSGDFFHYDKKHARFTGQRSRMIYTIGMPLMIRVQDANGMTGSLIFELAEGERLAPLNPSSRRKPGSSFHKKKNGRR